MLYNMLNDLAEAIRRWTEKRTFAPPVAPEGARFGSTHDLQAVNTYPRCCFAVLFCGETQIWLGDLRVALVFGVSCSWFVLICHSYGPYVSIFCLFPDFHCLRNCKDRA